MPQATFEPRSYPHQWLPATIDRTTWEQIEPWYRQLLDRPIDSPEDLETWLRDLGELNAVVSQEGSERYIAMTCQTDDPDRETAYLAFVRDIEPKLKPIQNALRNRFLDSPHRAALPKSTYAIFERAQETRRSLFREANIPRETALSELEQQYQKVVGAMTVTFREKEFTLAQMSPFLEETDRELRRTAWELVVARRLRDKDTLDDLFDRMLALRLEIAHEAGFDDYIGYAYKSRERFDYGEAEAVAFQKGIERTVVPLVKDLLERRRAALGVETLRPWDLGVDPQGRPPLRPFAEGEQLAAGVKDIFDRIDPDLGAQFQYLRDKGLLDLANRKGKAPGGYQATLEDDRLPFIFMNAVGMDGDLRTLLHEGGHAFHALASRDQPFAPYRDSPIEFCEVASMSMELLGARDLQVFYSDGDSERSYRQLLEGIITILPWIATVDAFQHWLYRNVGHTRADRRDAWNDLMDRFGVGVDWTGHEDSRSHSWHRQLHIFLYPFYYIEYGIAQLGALQIWRRAQTDRPGAIAAYRRALALGGSRTLPELFEGADIRFDFTEATLRPLMEAVRTELTGLGD